MKVLLPHQKKCIEFLRSRDGCGGIFLQVGCGKTLIAITSATVPTIVVCRRDDYYNWIEQIREYGCSKIVCIGSTKNFPIIPHDVEFVLCSYGLLSNKKKTTLNYLLEQDQFATIIADESHYIKSSNAERTRQVLRLSATIPHRIALSATPIGNEIGNIFSQALFIDGGKTFGRNFYEFRSQYFLNCGNFWLPKKWSRKDITTKLKTVAVSAFDILKLPERVYRVKSVPMTTEQRKQTELLEQEWAYSISKRVKDDDKVNLIHIIEQIQKLKQVASGFLYPRKKELPEKSHELIELPHNKLDLLTRLVQEIFREKSTTKIVVWASYTKEILDIEKELTTHRPYPAVFTHHGKMSPQERELSRDYFKNEPKKAVFVGQVDGGTGFNDLIGCNVAIYYSNSWRVISREQSEGRTYRKGSEKHKQITYYDILVEDSIEERILDCLRKKKNLAKEMLKEIEIEYGALQSKQSESSKTPSPMA